jgi:hypothetical protein
MVGGETNDTLGPQWLAHRYDESADQIRFVDFDRATRSAVPFLTDQYLPAKPFRAESRVSARKLAPATLPIHFVFHSGFCCSTLLASCLNQPGLATNFSEPMILNDVIGWRKRGADPATAGQLLDDSLAMLARPFAGDAAAVVKPSTVVNGLAMAMMRLRPESHAILIHAPLRDFLISIAKKGIDGRLWARELFISMRREGLTQRLGFDDEAFFGQTDLQIAASTWLLQQALFSDLAEAFPDRVRTIDSKRFLDAPADTIRAAAKLFRLELTDVQLEAAFSGPMKHNSKDGAAYDRAAREAEYAMALGAHEGEITKVDAWAKVVAETADIPLNLSGTLI